MSIIIRLQNLPWAANSADIRQYFQGYSIPNGGVFIVGGEKGDAFISFSTDEDTRQAVLLDNGFIKGVQIRLLMSSRNEMQNVIETFQQQSIRFSQNYSQQPPQLPITESLPPLTAKPRQQQMRLDGTVPMLRRYQSNKVQPSIVQMSKDTQHKQSLLQQQHLYTKSSGSDGNRSGSRQHRSRSRDSHRRRFDGRIERAGSGERNRRGGDRNSRSPVPKYCRNGQQQLPEINHQQQPMIQATQITKPTQQHNNVLPSNNYYHYYQQQRPQMPLRPSYYGGGPYGGGPYGSGPYSGGCNQQQYNNNNNNNNSHMMLNNRDLGYTPRMREANTGSGGFGQPAGCVVALNNVPYRANFRDIVDFFYGFELNNQNVIRQLNNFGNPTGEVRVTLKNPVEAMRAIRTLQNKPIHNRPVYLTLL